MPLLTVAPATRRELSRLLVILDDPLLVARACGHRLNRQHFSDCPRTFPLSLLKTFARRYWRLLVTVLDALVASDAYRAFPDYRKARAIREEQPRVAADIERRLSSSFLSAGHVLPGDTGRYPQRWGL